MQEENDNGKREVGSTQPNAFTTRTDDGRGTIDAAGEGAAAGTEDDATAAKQNDPARYYVPGGYGNTKR